MSPTRELDSGKHAFKGGVDMRSGNRRVCHTDCADSKSSEAPARITTCLSGARHAPNFVPNNETLANQLLYFLADR